MTAFPKPPSLASRKRARAAAHREEMAAIRGEVLVRAQFRCEHCGDHGRLEIDHRWGGSAKDRTNLLRSELRAAGAL